MQTDATTTNTVAKSLTGFKLCATTPNNTQQGVQTDATCNIQQCWELLAYNVASVCKGLNESYRAVSSFLWYCFFIQGGLNYIT